MWDRYLWSNGDRFNVYTIRSTLNEIFIASFYR